MAKYRKKSRARQAFGRMRRSFKSRSGTGNLLLTVGGSMAYGALRAKLSQWIEPITSKVPLGNIADEVTLATACYFGSRYVKVPVIKEALRSGLIIETARIGDALASGAISMGSQTSSSNDDGLLG